MSKIVISLGGSVVAPKHQDQNLLSKFADLFIRLAENQLVIIVVGGGYTARLRMEEARQAKPEISNDELDWIGINATYENAEKLKFTIQNKSSIQVYPEIIKDPNTVIDWKTGIVVGGGWKPGHSTDHCAALLAISNQVTNVHNISNVDQVYTADPKKDPTAKPLKDINWIDFQKMVGTEWTPGLSVPFDPIAASLSAEHNLTVTMMGGTDLHNIEERLLKGENYKDFFGTVIHS
jgi:uridylate kinase